MGLFTRRPKTTSPGLPTDAAVAAGMTTFLADLLAGDDRARGMLRGRAPMPADAAAWALYPTNPTRAARRNHFGGPSPHQLPQQRPTT
ncbi:hypothetical protein [Streptomyces hydrogenans]|uniref:hypothetical protein n=1 Tax=Streptomyces hydrogenans TaxID=1873719 RepID=UPI0036E1420D